MNHRDLALATVSCKMAPLYPVALIIVSLLLVKGRAGLQEEKWRDPAHVKPITVFQIMLELETKDSRAWLCRGSGSVVMSALHMSYEL